MSIEELEAEIMKLPEDQQLELLDRIQTNLAPMDPSVKVAWDKEIARRVQEIRDGSAVLHDEEDVMKEVQAILNEKNNIP